MIYAGIYCTVEGNGTAIKKNTNSELIKIYPYDELRVSSYFYTFKGTGVPSDHDRRELEGHVGVCSLEVHPLLEACLGHHHRPLR